MKYPDQQTLNRLLDYNPLTGKLFWKRQDRQYFASDRVWKIWNTKYAGKEAFTALTKGYKSGRIKGVLYLAHRVIWIMIKGFDPIEVDHEDGNRSNNI